MIIRTSAAALIHRGLVPRGVLKKKNQNYNNKDNIREVTTGFRFYYYFFLVFSDTQKCSEEIVK